MSNEALHVDPRDVDVSTECRGLELPVEMFNEIEPFINSRWLIKNLLMAGSSCVIFGMPGGGKSFLALDLGLHMAAHRPWFDRPTSGGGVVYIAAEGQGGLRARVEAWRRTHGDKDVAFALIPTVVDLLDPKVDLAKVREALAWVADIWGGIDLLIIDTLAATFGGGDENGADMAKYIANVAKLCEPYNCARIIVTHAPLTGDAKRPRGHGSLWGAADTVFEVSGDSHAAARRIHVTKQKDADPGPDIFFKLKQVEIGTDEDGDPVTSCVIEQSEIEAALPTRRPLPPTQKVVLEALDRALEAEGRFPPPAIPDELLNHAKTGKVVELSGWLSAALPVLASPDKKEDTPARQFRRAREKLQAAGVIGVWEEWVWRNF